MPETRLSHLDQQMMAQTIDEAHDALERGSAGIGALIRLGDEILALSHNTTAETGDRTAHAEMVALREAAEGLSELSPDELADVTLYTTLEPCLMCFAAISLAGIRRIVFSAYNSDGTDDVWVNRSITTDMVNSGLVRGPITLIGGVKREEGIALLEKMGMAGRSPELPD